MSPQEANSEDGQPTATRPALGAHRERIDELTAEPGRYYVVCERTGDRPVPVADGRFPDRTSARRAAEAAERYRAALRRYDPQVARYDLVVRRTGDRSATAPGHACPDPADGQWSLSDPVVPETDGQTAESAQPSG